jgi:hypothetical protein
MKKTSILTLTMIALASFMAITVWAVNPHFLSCGANGVNNDGTLNVSFKIAGLGGNQSLTVTASADGTATYGCRNHGGQCPDAANKVTVNGPVSAQGIFTSGKNGSISGSLTVDPPPVNPSFTCPNGQKLVLVSASYTNVSVSAPAAGNCSTSPATFAANFFPNCP